MQFENAKKGIKHIYHGELIMLASSVVALVATLLIGVFGSAKNGEGNAMDAIGGALFVVVSVASIVAFVLEILGVFVASKDEVSFKNSLYALIAGIVFSVLASAFKQGGFVSDLMGIGKTVCDFLSSYFVICGIVALANKIRNADVEKTGKTTLRLLMIVWLSSIIVKFVSNLIKNDSSVIVTILQVISTVLAIISYVFFLKLLSKADKML